MTSEQFSSICRALGDSNRLEIMRVLSEKELCGCRILEALKITQPTLSHHMKILEEASLVSSRKAGKWTYYSVNHAVVDEFRSASVCGKAAEKEGGQCQCGGSAAAGSQAAHPHSEKAAAYFGRKFLCSQAVIAAFADECGLSEEQALQLGACFGSGMRKGEVCGACTGALVVLGLLYGQRDVSETDKRLKTNEVTVRLLERFESVNGSYLCRDLLKCDISTEEGRAYAVEHKLFTEFCPKMVESAASILEDMIFGKI